MPNNHTPVEAISLLINGRGYLVIGSEDQCRIGERVVYLDSTRYGEQHLPQAIVVISKTDEADMLEQIDYFNRVVGENETLRHHDNYYYRCNTD